MKEQTKAMITTPAHDLSSTIAELVRLQEKLYATRVECWKSAMMLNEPHRESMKRIFHSLRAHSVKVDGMIKQLQKETK